MTDVIYLSLRDVLVVAQRVLGAVEVRDPGGLASAVARPQTSVFGEDAYATLNEKAAALAHSVARNHALVDGNKRLALANLIAFYGVNGRELTLTNEEAYDLIMDLATGDLADVGDIAGRLRGRTRPRSR